MAAAWPAILPTGFLNGFAMRPRDATVRSQMDVGRGKRRSRATYVWDELDAEIFCSRAQAEALRLFHRETLVRGTLTFSITSPVDRRVYDAVFREPPETVHVGGEYFRARLALELFDVGVLSAPALWPDGVQMLWPDGVEVMWP